MKRKSHRKRDKRKRIMAVQLTPLERVRRGLEDIAAGRVMSWAEFVRRMKEDGEEHDDDDT